jgi:long-chain acyl-CoA synthetase
MDNLQELISSLKNKSGIAKSWKNVDNVLEEESFSSYHNKIQSLSRGFLELGIKKGDHVAHIADNNPDWIAVSLALNNIGAVDVPRASDSTIQELEYILNHSDSSYLIVKNESRLNRIQDIVPKTIKEIITLDNSSDLSIDKIISIGKTSSRELPAVSGDDLSGIIYTSGTTGSPKGVMLTHMNFISNFTMLEEFEDMREDDVWLSILPPAHVFQRTAEYCALNSGAKMHHTSVANVSSALLEVKPTIMPTVPRVWESIYDKAMKKLDLTIDEQTGLKKYFMNLLIPKIIPNTIVPESLGKKVRESLGGNMRLAVSGGGSLVYYIDDFFRKAGIAIANGYGMTETSPVISAIRLGDGKDSRHTVGCVMPNTRVKIADPDTNEQVFGYGEVQVSGPGVMKGYYKDPEATAKILYTDENEVSWLKTGDRGKFKKNIYLELNGRYKETIIGSDGENIDPVNLEDLMNKNPLIKTSMVFKYKNSNLLFALTVPDFDKLEQFCSEHNISYSKDKLVEVLAHPEVRAAYDSALKKYNSSVKKNQMIAKISLLDRAFEIGTEVTATFKLRRKEILENRNYIVKELVNDK